MNHSRRLIALACAATTLLAGCETMSGGKQPRRAVRADRVDLIEPTEQQQAQLILAQEATDAGDYEVALAMFQDIIAENPTIPTAYVGMGDVYAAQEQYEAAEPAYRRATQLDPFNYDAHFGHGFALQMLDRLVEAILAYHKALTIQPESHDANLSLATTYLQMNEAHSAVVFAEKAVELDQESGSAHANLGAAYENLGRTAEAIDEYLIAIELIDEPAPVMLNLVNALSKERRYRETVNAATNLIRIEPSANAYERLGWAYFKLNDYDASIEAYRAGARFDRNHWPSLNGIGVNALNKWLLSGKTDSEAAEEARTAFRRSLRLKSDQERVIELLSHYGL